MSILQQLCLSLLLRCCRMALAGMQPAVSAQKKKKSVTSLQQRLPCDVCGTRCKSIKSAAAKVLLCLICNSLLSVQVCVQHTEAAC